MNNNHAVKGKEVNTQCVGVDNVMSEVFIHKIR